MAQPVGQADLGERGRGQLPRLGGRLAQEERRDHGVLERGQLAEQVVELEDEADVLSPVVDKPRLAAREQVLATEEDAARCGRSEEHTSELQSRGHLVCRLLLEKKNNRVSQSTISIMEEGIANFSALIDVIATMICNNNIANSMRDVNSSIVQKNESIIKECILL